jgi:hypothetical protein
MCKAVANGRRFRVEGVLSKVWESESSGARCSHLELHHVSLNSSDVLKQQDCSYDSPRLVGWIEVIHEVR